MTRTKQWVCMILVGLCLTAVCHAVQSSGGNTPEPYSFLKDPNSTLRQNDRGGGSGYLFMKAIMALIFVIAMGIGLAYVSKRLLPRLGVSAGKDIRVVETIGIGPRKALHLIDVGSQRILIGSTPDTITFLTRVDEEGDFAGVMATRLGSPEETV